MEPSVIRTDKELPYSVVERKKFDINLMFL